MAVDGTTLHDFSFYDKETNKIISVTLTIRDGVYFKLLEQLIETIRSKT